MRKLILTSILLLLALPCYGQELARLSTAILGGRVASGSTPTTINLQVASDADDGVLDGTTNCNSWTNAYGGSFGVAGYGSDAIYYRTGYRFNSVTVPQGSTINSATLQLRAHSVSGTLNVNIRIVGDDVDDAPAFGVDSCPILEGWTSTTAVTDLSISTWDYDSWYSYDVTDIVQEIINRAGWASGNDLRLGIIDNGNTSSHALRIYDYSGGATYAAKLDIEYQ